MARRFETLLRVKPRDNLGDPEFWNRRWDDTDRRIAATEDALSNLDEVGKRVESVALDRVNNVITPIAQEAVDRLRTVSNAFFADSASTHSLTADTKTFKVLENQRSTFAPLSYVRINVAGDIDKAIVGLTSSYNQLTGDLTVIVEQVFGTGTYSLWEIGPALSSNDVELLRDTVEAHAAQVAEDRTVVAADRATTTSASTAAVTARNQAETFRDQAQAMAAAAATFNPADFVAKAGTTTMTGPMKTPELFAVDSDGTGGWSIKAENNELRFYYSDGSTTTLRAKITAAGLLTATDIGVM